MAARYPKTDVPVLILGWACGPATALGCRFQRLGVPFFGQHAMAGRHVSGCLEREGQLHVNPRCFIDMWPREGQGGAESCKVVAVLVMKRGRNLRASAERRRDSRWSMAKLRFRASRNALLLSHRHVCPAKRVLSAAYQAA